MLPPSVKSLKPRFGYDDVLDVFGIHGICSVVGAIGAGLFATSTINGTIAGGLFFGNPSQLGVQLLAIAVVGAYSLVMTLIIGKVIDKTIGLRVDEDHEIEGLDINFHEEAGYRL